MVKTVESISHFNKIVIAGVTIVAVGLLMASHNSLPALWLEESSSGYECSATPTSFSKSTRENPDADLLKPEELLALKYVDGAIDRNLTEQRRYLRHIRALMTGPPAPSTVDGSRPRPVLKDPKKIHYSQINQSLIVDQFLNGRPNGFFVECGAHDGEVLSNSLFFELHRNWTGLLIDSDIPNYIKMLKKNRNAYTFGGCLSPTGKPQMLPFLKNNFYGGVAGVVEGLNDPDKGAALTSVFCVPLTDLLAAIGRNHVDYLSLDIEGAEPEVLETIDWNKVKIDVMTIEFGRIHSLRRIRKVVERTGLFREVRLIEWDIMYARNE